MNEKSKEEILTEQLNRQYELNKQQTDALCNVMNSIKSIFKYIFICIGVVASVAVISYFFSPQDYTFNVNGDKNTTTGTMLDNTIDENTIGGEQE